MNDANYIIKNIAMLKRNTINVKNLTNKFCIELSKNYGISRTESLENTISEILTKYKQGEISDDIVVESFGSILNKSSSTNPNVNTSVNTKTSTTTSYTTTKKAVDEKSNPSSSEPGADTNVEVKKEVKEEVKVEETTEKPAEEPVEEKIEEPVVEEKTEESIVQGVEHPVEETTEETVEKTSMKYVNSGKTSSKSSAEAVVDVNSTNLGDVINSCAGIEGGLEGAEISAPPLVAKYASELISAASAISGVTACLNIFKGIVADTIQTAADSDVEFGNEDLSKLSWSELYDMYDRSQNSKAVRVDEEFFKNCEIQGNFAILTIDGRECKYDMKKHKFYVDGKAVIDADIFVPSGASDYSNLNTYTFFTEGGYLNHITSGKDGEGGTGQSTNSVLIQVKKQGVWSKFDETGLLTKFVNQVAKTNLETCKNVIGGDSMYGTFALRTAANNKGLYDTVYCINNAVIATGINNNGGDKQQMTQEEVANLDGLDIYFISVAGDPNLDHGKRYHNFGAKGGPFNEAYTYTGLVYLLNKCPNANVHMVYSSNAASPHNAEMQIYKDLEQQFDNYEYIPEAWLDFANDNYQTHTSGNYIPAEASKAAATNSKK